jgi:hypothetical protein
VAVNAGAGVSVCEITAVAETSGAAPGDGLDEILQASIKIKTGINISR